MSSPQLTSKNNYHIIDCIGSGNFGSVMHVSIHEDQKVYALKQISFQNVPATDRAAAVNDAKNEYQLLKKGIPNVLKAFGSNYDEKTHMFKFSTELMDMNLTQLIEKKGSLTYSEFIPIFQDILSGKKRLFKYT